jgi:hypothetical protein
LKTSLSIIFSSLLSLIHLRGYETNASNMPFEKGHKVEVLGHMVDISKQRAWGRQKAQGVRA